MLFRSGDAESRTQIDWQARYQRQPGRQVNISKPANWQNYEYPFVYGQPDPTLFPLAAWRECSRQAMSELAMRDWSSDAIWQDDLHLVHEIRTKLLPKRGIYAKESEILITAGAQNALYLLAALLMGDGVTVAVEEPGYPDARNIFAIHQAKLLQIPVDREGAQLPQSGLHADYMFVTPGLQSPTTVTMSKQRRADLLEYAARQDMIIIEDDYESETHYGGDDLGAMKSEDHEGRVIYLGSLSKSMFPGLRLGYIVANEALISELRGLRRLMLRHTPSNNQRTTSLFISQGYHASYVRKLNKVYTERWDVLKAGLDQYLPGLCQNPTYGGSSFWLSGPTGLESSDLAARALKQGVVIEPGDTHFMMPASQQHHFRLGFSSIPTEKIKPGLQKLAQVLDI